ncbi:MAG: cupin domain-containing protein [Alphaproteobacteria bacterium]
MVTKVLTPSREMPQALGLRTQMLSQGHSKRLLACTDLMTFHVHCYGPKGGENGLHTHMDEDHVFVILQGELLFRGLDGPLPPLRRHQALFLPKGCYYSFSNETEEPAIVIRFGASAELGEGRRFDPEMNPLEGRSHLKHAPKPLPIEGEFFD